MDKVSLELQVSRTHMTECRGLKQYLPARNKQLRTKAGSYLAEFDGEFCLDAKPAKLIEQVETLLNTGQIIKEGDTCHVSRLVWNYRDVVVKRYNHKGLIHSLRHTLKKSRARKAWLHARRLEALGIPTPKPLAYVEQRRGHLVWQSYLVTEYVDGRLLYDFVRDETVPEQQRFNAVRQVVEMLDELWKHGITHGDLKHTNVLVAEDGPLLTDLDAMAAHKWKLLYRNRRRKDMERFLKKMSASQELYDHCRALVSDTIDSPKKLPDNFHNIRKHGWTIRISETFSQNDILRLLSPGKDSPESFTQVPSSDFTKVFKGNMEHKGTDYSIYLKQYLCRSALDFAKHLFRLSRARRAFNASLMLLQNGFRAPAVIGLLERRFGPLCIENALLTEQVEAGRSMVDVLNELCRDSSADALIRKRALIRAFAETVGRMHARGIFHGDLRLGNVLVVKRRQDWQFYFIDNERTQQYHHLPSRLRLKNLVQVNLFIHGISNTDRLRFFTEYLAVNPSIQRHYRRWAEKIITKTNERLSRKDWLDS